MLGREDISVVSMLKEVDNERNVKFSKDEPAYWNMLSEIILESQRIRYEQNISQKELSEKMETKQSVISRFENLGRTPNYDFLVRLAHGLGCNPKMYLDGDASVQVPYELRDKLEAIVSSKKITIEDYLVSCIKEAIEKDYQTLTPYTWVKKFDINSVLLKCTNQSVNYSSGIEVPDVNEEEMAS